MTRLRALHFFIKRYSHILFFVGGFLFDLVTLVRIDSTLDLVYQTIYLLLITWLLVLQVRHDQGLWQPTGRAAKLWHYQLEALHFFYGGLLSAYVIFYFKSSTGSRSAIFITLVAVLLIVNEMPQIRHAGSHMRLGLHAFCLVSFLNYLLPVLIGRMGGWVFALAVLLSVVGSVALLRKVASLMPNPRRAYWTLGWAPALVLLLVVGFYVKKWIPPVPLSVQYAGVFHKVERQEESFLLTYRKPPWYRFWRRDDRLFLARPGDRVYCFVRVFAPRRFTHQVYLRWQLQASSGQWSTSDRIALPIYGGRGEGFRGVVMKDHYAPGHWRIDIETEDERTLGTFAFEIRPDPSMEEVRWAELRM